MDTRLFHLSIYFLSSWILLLEYFSGTNCLSCLFGGTDTTPPKKRITDLTKDFYSANLVPGALVRFHYDVPEGPVVLAPSENLSAF